MFLESIGIDLALSPDLLGFQHDRYDGFEAFISTRRHPLILAEHSGPGLLMRGEKGGGNADPCMTPAFVCCDRLILEALSKEEWRTSYQAS
jgi:hypothetical protein